MSNVHQKVLNTTIHSEGCLATETLVQQQSQTKMMGCWACNGMGGPYLLVGAEQLVPGEALELHMAHMALLEPGQHARGQDCSWPTGFVLPLVVLDVQHQAEHDISTLAHLPFCTCLCCPCMDCHHKLLYTKSPEKSDVIETWC